jgi:hypothetical protein
MTCRARLASTQSTYCARVYAVQALSKELTAVSANYTDVNNEYIGLFCYDVDYVKDMISSALGAFMGDVHGRRLEYGRRARAGRQYF